MNRTIFFILTIIIATSPYAGQVRDSNWASRSDVAEAQNFLSQLPSACADSHAYASRDGTVHVRLICNGNGESIDGLVSIKDGIVKQIR